jgi:glycosyltransferase involved in cell wall biosynthesis
LPRVAHLISAPAGIGGAERVMAAIATAERPGWEQAVVNVSGPNAELAAACAPLEPRQRAGGVPLLSGRRAAVEALDDLRPDVVHAHLPLAMVTLASLRRRNKQVRLATHHHGDHFVVSGRRAARRLDRAAGARLDLLVAPSDAVRRLLLADYGYGADAVRTIVNGWEGVAPPSDAPKAVDPTVISVANFRPQKNHEMLLRAFAKVLRQMPEARLLLVGGGEREEEIRRLAGSLGIDETVEFTGYVDDVWPYLSRSHVFALSSSYEPLGVAVLEGMAAGLPVVATAVGGVPELVRPEANGVLVPGDDVGAMAAALLDLLGDRGRAERLGAGARATASGHTAERMVEEYFGLYSELLAKST